MKAVRHKPGCRRFDCLPVAEARLAGAARARPRTGRTVPCSRAWLSATLFRASPDDVLRRNW